MEPLTTRGRIPANSCAVARVATIAGIFSLVINKPLIKLRIAPVIIARGKSTKIFACIFPAIASTIQTTEIKAPVETSIFEVIIMRFIPIAAMIT